jgi:cell fate regulator YaaT (PSP1 superfamily)
VETPPELIEEENKPGKPLKNVFRKANEKDLSQVEQNLALEREAHAFCLKSIKALGLKMNLFSVESTFDASRLTFFFTADGRVDFRQLVKILVKQVQGPHRDAPGGHSQPGQDVRRYGPLRARTSAALPSWKSSNRYPSAWPSSRASHLNPTKISGQCGRLMCCLTFENETYRKLKQGFPKSEKS